MKILFLLRLWPVYGGGETVTICLANEMIRRGWQVNVAYFKEHSIKDLPFIDSRITSYKIENIDCDEFHTKNGDAPKASLWLGNFVINKSVDVVINQWWSSDYIAGVKGVGKAKIITCLHQALYTPIADNKGLKGMLIKRFWPLYLAYKKRKAVKETVRKFIPVSDKYIFLSPTFQRQYEQLSGNIDEFGKLASIPNPLVFEYNITDTEFCNKENIVLVVGRMLEGQKRISRILKTWSIIQQHPVSNGWLLQIVGDGPDLPMYKEMAKSLFLRNTSFEGFQNPSKYYKKAKIFMMSSAFEGFGMTLLEAQQQGVIPVVMDSYLSLHDIIKNDENGIITPDANIDYFAHTIIELMSDDDKRIRLAKRGIETCQEFSVKNIVNKWEKLFECL